MIDRLGMGRRIGREHKQISQFLPSFKRDERALGTQMGSQKIWILWGGPALDSVRERKPSNNKSGGWKMHKG